MVLGVFVFSTTGYQQVNDMVNGNTAGNTNTATKSIATANTNANGNANTIDKKSNTAVKNSKASTESNQTNEILGFEKSPLAYYSNLSVSPNGKRILYARLDQSQSAIMVGELN